MHVICYFVRFYNIRVQTYVGKTRVESPVGITRNYFHTRNLSKEKAVFHRDK